MKTKNPVQQKAVPRVDIDATKEGLSQVGLSHAAESLETRIAEAIKDEIAPHRFLDLLLKDEIDARDERRVRTSLRLSGLPTGQTLGTFDFAFGDVPLSVELLK